MRPALLYPMNRICVKEYKAALKVFGFCKPSSGCVKGDKISVVKFSSYYLLTYSLMTAYWKLKHV
jgi:hypothetical protein